MSSDVPGASNDRPSLDGTTGREVLVVWSGERLGAGPTDGVMARPMQRSGPVGPEHFLNDGLPDATAVRASVAFDQHPTGFVAWEDFDGDEAGGSGDGISGRWITKTGFPLGTQIRINQHKQFNQRRPAVARTRDGDALVVWQDEGHVFKDPDVSRIVARFLGQGGSNGNEFELAATEDGRPHGVRLAGLPSGGFATVWTREATENGGAAQNLDVVLSILDDVGDVRSQTSVSGDSAGDHFSPNLAVCDDGRVFVAWASNAAAEDPDVGIVGQWFSTDGVPLTDAVRMNEHLAGRQNHPVVATTPDCSAIVVWQSDEQDGDGEGVFGARITPDLTLSKEFQVSAEERADQGSGFFRTLDVHAVDQNEFVVVWPNEEPDTREYPLLARWFCFLPEDEFVCGDATCVRSPDAQAGIRDAVTVADAQAILLGSVGLRDCSVCRCDMDGSGVVETRDALAALRKSLGFVVPERCPTAC